MSASLHRSVWRTDFHAVPPVERRIARYALQLFRQDPQTALDLANAEVLGALWRLILPLLEPQAVIRLLQPVADAGDEPERDDESEGDEADVTELPAALRKAARGVLQSLPAWVLTRLADADGTDPTSATVVNLGQALGLSRTEVLILDYLEHRELRAPLRRLLRAGRHGRLSAHNVARVNRERLAAHGRGNLCFFGPPGTGKTALAEALDRELAARQASDLLSPYVGETEQNLARLFRTCDPLHTVLLLDEVDSFLADRRLAHHAWERTQVNELLQQMERYPGIFIAATTNLMSGLDTAALRRFDFKLQFQPLKPAQRMALFAREIWGDAEAVVPPEWVRHLETLHSLTPGDFATVCRQRALLGEALTPEQFLRRLTMECRLKQVEPWQKA